MSEDPKERTGRTSKNTGLGLVFGAGVGISLGTVFGDSGLGLAFWLPFGAGIGLVIGAVLAEREKKGAG